MSSFSKIPDAEQVLMRLMELKVKTRQEALSAIKDLFRNETLVSDEGAEALLGVLCSFGLVTIDDESGVWFAGA
jgi:hypothetical protein